MPHIKDINIAGVDVRYSRSGSRSQYSDGRTHLSVVGTDISLVNNERMLPITSNSSAKYMACGLPVTEILTYGRSLHALEIGTGVSEFTPMFATVAHNIVTAVGLENYPSVSRVNKAVIHEGVEHKNAIERAGTFVRRAEVMMDTGLVDYREGDFYEMYESLERGPKFDLIIAFLSVFQYPLRSKPETHRMLSSLLKPRGQIFSEYRPS